MAQNPAQAQRDHYPYVYLKSTNLVKIFNFCKFGSMSHTCDRDKQITYSPSTSSSLKRRYSGIVNCSTLRSYTFTRTYSQTPGLGRTAIATNGGSTMASYFDKKAKALTAHKLLVS